MPKYTVWIMTARRNARMQYKGYFENIHDCINHYAATWEKHGGRIISVKESRLPRLTNNGVTLEAPKGE